MGRIFTFPVMSRQAIQSWRAEARRRGISFFDLLTEKGRQIGLRDERGVGAGEIEATS